MLCKIRSVALCPCVSAAESHAASLSVSPRQSPVPVWALLWGPCAMNPLARYGTAWYGGQAVAGSVQEQIAKICGLRRVLAAWATATPALQHQLRAGPGLCGDHCSLPPVWNSRGTWLTAWRLFKSFWNNYPHATDCLKWQCAPKGRETDCSSSDLMSSWRNNYLETWLFFIVRPLQSLPSKFSG